MENVLLVRYGEIHLKGLNRPYFERKLVERINSSADIVISVINNVLPEPGEP